MIAGDGARIVFNAVPNGLAAEAGAVTMIDATDIVVAGGTGTVEFVTGITAAATADAVGTSAIPVRVVAGEVVVSSNYGNVYVTGLAPTAFHVTDGALPTQTGAGPTIRVGTGGAPMTIDALTSAAGGPIILNAAASVGLNTPIGGPTAGPITITGRLEGSGGITLGIGGLTITQDFDSTYDGVISGAQSVTKTGPGALTLTARVLTAANDVLAGFRREHDWVRDWTGKISARRATFGGTGAVTGSVAVDGTHHNRPAAIGAG